MAADDDSVALVLALSQACEDLAGAALDAAQARLVAKTMSQDDFNQAYQDYSTAMQRARDMYYQASHSLAQQIASSNDLKNLTKQTADLNKSLANLKSTEKALTISFGVVTAIAAVATAVTAPSAATLGAAATAIGSLANTITAGSNS